MKYTSREANFMFWGEVKGGEGHEEPGEGAAHRRGDDAAAAGRPGPRLFPHHYFPGKGAVQPLAAAGLSHRGALRRDGGGPVLPERK